MKLKIRRRSTIRKPSRLTREELVQFAYWLTLAESDLARCISDETARGDRATWLFDHRLNCLHALYLALNPDASAPERKRAAHAQAVNA